MESWQQQVAERLQAGRKIEAIKLYRDATGASLLDAKNFVEELERTLATGQLPASRPVDSQSAADNQPVLDLLRRGERVQAIKLYREREGVGLAEGLAAVNQLAAEAGIETPKSGCFGLLVTGMAALATLATAIALVWW